MASSGTGHGTTPPPFEEQDPLPHCHPTADINLQTLEISETEYYCDVPRTFQSTAHGRSREQIAQILDQIVSRLETETRQARLMHNILLRLRSERQLKVMESHLYRFNYALSNTYFCYLPCRHSEYFMTPERARVARSRLQLQTELGQCLLLALELRERSSTVTNGEDVPRILPSRAHGGRSPEQIAEMLAQADRRLVFDCEQARNMHSNLVRFRSEWDHHLSDLRQKDFQLKITEGSLYRFNDKLRHTYYCHLSVGQNFSNPHDRARVRIRLQLQTELNECSLLALELRVRYLSTTRWREAS